jgi:iron complex transport system permease protein
VNPSRTSSLLIFLLITGCIITAYIHVPIAAEAFSGTVWWQLRFPRLVNALLVGGVLGMLGISTQTVFGNPLADTSLTGINAGTSLGVAFSLLLIPAWLPWVAWNTTLLVVLGIVGGTLFAVGLLFLLKRLHQKMNQKINQQTNHLLFIGLAFMLFSNALLALLLVWQDEQSTRSFLFWSLGNFQLVGWDHLWVGIPFAIVLILWLLKRASSFDLLLLGPVAAQSLGLNTAQFYRVYWWVAAVLVGVSMTLAGGIGWVGLIAGHLSRRFFGAHHKVSLPGAALVGMLLCVWADLIAVHLFYPIEIPVGAIISLLGSLMFVYLIQQPAFIKRGI